MENLFSRWIFTQLGMVMPGQENKKGFKGRGEANMIFARLIVHYDDHEESSPYLFCSKCKALLLADYIKFCPWCGHKLKDEEKVQIINVNDNEVNNGSFEDYIDFIRKKVKWE